MMRKLYETYSNTLPCAGCNHVHKITLCEDKPCTRYCEECRDDHPVKDVRDFVVCLSVCLFVRV